MLAALIDYDGKRFELAERQLRPLADEGNLTALYKLGMALSSMGREQEAYAAWRVGAREGDPRAMNNIGTVLLDEGREEDALRYFTLAAEAGSREGAFNLANLHEDLGNEADFVALMQELAESGMPRAFGRLGIHYLERGGSGSANRAVEAFAQGVAVGNALSHVGMAMEAGRRGDFLSVRRWSELALQCRLDEYEEATGLVRDAHCMAAAACIELQDYESALRHLEITASDGDDGTRAMASQVRELIKSMSQEETDFIVSVDFYVTAATQGSAFTAIERVASNSGFQYAIIEVEPG